MIPLPLPGMELHMLPHIALHFPSQPPIPWWFLGGVEREPLNVPDEATGSGWSG